MRNYTKEEVFYLQKMDMLHLPFTPAQSFLVGSSITLIRKRWSRLIVHLSMRLSHYRDAFGFQCRRFCGFVVRALIQVVAVCRRVSCEWLSRKSVSQIPHSGGLTVSDKRRTGSGSPGTECQSRGGAQEIDCCGCLLLATGIVRAALTSGA